MTECPGKYEQVENELAEIAAEITALGDMIPGLLLNSEDMEQGTPRGIKILLTDIERRIHRLRKYIDGNCAPSPEKVVNP
jgi:hypothetical protein